jgi:hypothetical protein
MTPATDWNNRWFGVWRETGATYSACPSVQDFMDPAALAEFDKGRLVRVLGNSARRGVDQQAGVSVRRVWRPAWRLAFVSHRR